MTSGSWSSLKELAVTPSAISFCNIGSRNAAWKGEHALNMSNKWSCKRMTDSPFYQILFGHRPWDLCQQKWLGCHASAQGSAWYNQTCWYFFLETHTIQPHQMSEKQVIKLLSQYTTSYIKTIVLIYHCTHRFCSIRLRRVMCSTWEEILVH